MGPALYMIYARGDFHHWGGNYSSRSVPCAQCAEQLEGVVIADPHGLDHALMVRTLLAFNILQLKLHPKSQFFKYARHQYA